MNTKKEVNPQKSSLVSSIKDLISSSLSVAVVDYSGLKVSQAVELRKLVKKAGGRMLITKNTLFKIASGIKNLDLQGQSAFIFSQTDAVSALKVIAQYSKKNNLLAFKSGILGDRVLTAEEVAMLSAIPDKQTLLTKTVSALNSPLFHLAYNLNWNLTKLVRTLEEVKLHHV